MTDTPDMFEGRLSGYSKQSRADGDWIEVRFQVHPEDVTPALAAAPLKTVFMVAAVPVPKAESSKPEKSKRTWDEIPLSEQAGIRCADPRFQKWLAGYFDMPLNPNEDLRMAEATARIKAHCWIQSRSELLPDTEPGNNWLAIDEDFRKSQGLITEQR